MHAADAQEEHRNEAGLLDLAASAQLRHQLSLLSMALQTAQLDPAQFGLAPTVRHEQPAFCAANDGVACIVTVAWRWTGLHSGGVSGEHTAQGGDG
jgi:hypothetical protein